MRHTYKHKLLQATYADYRELQEIGRLSAVSRFVPGDGPLPAEVMFIGEAPGYNENQEGRPFVGASGRALNSIIQKADLLRSDVFVTNVVKYRPHQNRDPYPSETAASLHCLLMEIRIVSPKVICTLGLHALHALCPDAGGITRIHGLPKWDHDRGRWILPLYHPAVSLYSPDMRKVLEDDMNVLRHLLDTEEVNADHEVRILASP